MALAAALPSARALLNLDGTRNQLFVFGSVGFAYDSNIFSDSTNRGDSSITGSVGAELKRRAGIIAVNGSVIFHYTAYGTYSEESSFDPTFTLELNKTTGRTTGALTFGAYHESRSDSAVNMRTNSWNFPVGLNIKYPVNDRYYLTSGTHYMHRQYVDNESLVDYADISEAVDVFYVYTSKLDLLAGYRIRYTKTAADGEAYDHWINVGATGGILPKLNGSLRFGYQVRDVREGDDYGQFNIVASLSWPVSRKLTLSGQLSRDFSTIATGTSIDTMSGDLRATYAYNRKLNLNAGINGGQNRFLSPPERRDSYFGYDVGAQYTMNEHLQVGASYSYFINWSSASTADFERHGFSVDITGRY